RPLQDTRDSRGEPLFEEGGGFGAFEAAANRVHNTATNSPTAAVEAEPVRHVDDAGLARDFDLTSTEFEKTLLEDEAQDFFTNGLLSFRFRESWFKEVASLNDLHEVTEERVGKLE